MKDIPLLLVVLGATATGKTRLAVKIAIEINGEIISADSRQVYKGLDLGTGKDLNEYKINTTDIPYHLIDIRSIDQTYSVYDFQRDALVAIEKIINKNKTPIICGGTGLYIEALLLNYKFNKFNPDVELREKLSKMSIHELDLILKQLDSNIIVEKNNRHRYIRAIEIALQNNNNSNEQDILEYNINKSLVFGIRYPRDMLRERIHKRLLDRIEAGMIEEVKILLENNIDPNKLIAFGLEYKFITMYLLGKLTYDEMIDKLYTAICQFAKRQETWFRRMEKRNININWIDGRLEEEKKIKEILNKINNEI
ncbi:MAG: tRNA (adenosine(37)-N6)-dimethylallyltransferase MiaA [Bacteroidales bacterium]|jgi:tRNA dimethylallyltransferase|nr:tRNA (adenosine(37)-N6)-dimethylallyltransferase MiaA [Bacteroidales bacterium]MDI9575558.1 tRNA (adenosine(37)-N6)-dimethylallyltransferase MiaA [Bacteroidota bacterium]MDD3755643.1 tRNA (adenosine(37)-N6)-dimethylallyltransferase MiaA [Bacteroidales bacterium]MDY0401374.1 tRNA (adenosine(37)-N6)-dimethylallyltransferase MiaA [Bacteroidales bacterium]HHW59278.1 tRNA (adenosine(37)-N6)-dimethylallyltransferase MiaA [Bacteroidales bacterium]